MIPHDAEKERFTVIPGGSEALRFFQALWPHPPEDAAIVLWSLPGKITELAANAQIAAQTADRLKGRGQDVYAGVCAVRANLEAGRGKGEDMRWQPALALDLDVVAEGRGKSRLFESLAAAEAFLSELPLPPSIVVASGAGIQPWWLFKEPLYLGSQQEAEEAKKLAVGWYSYVRALALAVGSELDAVHDSTRLLRVPGTLNRKYKGVPRPVTLRLCEPSRRYNPVDFEPYVTEVRRSVAGVVVGELVLDPGANPDAGKMSALSEIDPRFKQTFTRKRKDLLGKSDSEWDMSLASQAVAAGWPDQEVCNLLIAHRREHGGAPKLREDYYARTIRRARENHVAATIGSEVSSGAVDLATESGKAKVLSAFSVQTGAAITAVYRYLPDGDRLAFSFDDGRSEFFCTLSELCDWFTFWKRLWAAGFSPHTLRPKQAEWLALVNALQGIAETRYVDGGGKSALVAYYATKLAQRSNLDLEPGAPDSDEPTRARAIESYGAFLRGGILWVRLRGLAEIAESNRSTMALSELGHYLLAAGGEKRQFTARKQGRKKQVNGIFYGVPVETITRLSGTVVVEEMEPDLA